jgi:phage-related protein
VKEFIDGLSDVNAAAVAAAMKDVAAHGKRVAHHLRGDIYEVIAPGDRETFRVLYAEEGRSGQVLLALEAISKKTPKVPARTIELAVKRLNDWRSRGRAGN